MNKLKILDRSFRGLKVLVNTIIWKLIIETNKKIQTSYIKDIEYAEKYIKVIYTKS